MNMRASLENFRIFLSKTPISFNILLVFQILCLRKHVEVSHYICIIKAVPFITYGMALYI